MSRTNDEDRSVPAPNQSIYGRPDCYNYISYGEQVDPTQPWKTDEEAILHTLLVCDYKKEKKKK